MKTNIIINLLLAAFSLVLLTQQLKAQNKTEPVEKIESNPEGQGLLMTLKLEKGTGYNHPLIVMWLETEEGKFIETLFLTETIGKEMSTQVINSSGKKKKESADIPAALPYWKHQSEAGDSGGLLQSGQNNRITDAIIRPVPGGSFDLSFHLSNCPAGNCRILIELNQSNESGEYGGSHHSNEPEFITSSQPSVIYEAVVDPHILPDSILMGPIGLGNETAKTGILRANREAMTSSLQIASKITLVVGQ